jgi:hypothetical protein
MYDVYPCVMLTGPTQGHWPLARETGAPFSLFFVVKISSPTRQQSRYSFILANTEVLHDKIGVLSSRVRQLEDALADAYAMYNSERHPLLSDDLLQIKRPLERESRNEIPSIPEADTAEAIDAVGSLWVWRATVKLPFLFPTPF